MVAHIFTLLLAPFASKSVHYSRRSETLNFRKNSKSTTFSFDSNDLSIFKHTSNTHCVSNKWPIWTQKVQKEAYIEMWTTNFCNSFFKNIFLYIIDWLSKIRLVHTYVIHRKVCLIGSVYHLKFCRVSGIRRNKTK